jgi:hypothetical protein
MATSSKSGCCRSCQATFDSPQGSSGDFCSDCLSLFESAVESPDSLCPASVQPLCLASIQATDPAQQLSSSSVTPPCVRKSFEHPSMVVEVRQGSSIASLVPPASTSACAPFPDKSSESIESGSATVNPPHSSASAKKHVTKVTGQSQVQKRVKSKETRVRERRNRRKRDKENRAELQEWRAGRSVPESVLYTKGQIVSYTDDHGLKSRSIVWSVDTSGASSSVSIRLDDGRIRVVEASSLSCVESESRLSLVRPSPMKPEDVRIARKFENTIRSGQSAIESTAWGLDGHTVRHTCSATIKQLQKIRRDVKHEAKMEKRSSNIKKERAKKRASWSAEHNPRIAKKGKMKDRARLSTEHTITKAGRSVSHHQHQHQQRQWQPSRHQQAQPPARQASWYSSSMRREPQLCWHFPQGRCRDGDRCRFLHRRDVK